MNAKVEIDSLADDHGIDQGRKFKELGTAENVAQQRASQCAGTSQARTAGSDRVQDGIVFTASIFFRRVDGGAILSGCRIVSLTRQRSGAERRIPRAKRAAGV